jgi:hypothetical protein
VRPLRLDAKAQRSKLHGSVSRLLERRERVAHGRPCVPVFAAVNHCSTKELCCGVKLMFRVGIGKFFVTVDGKL